MDETAEEIQPWISDLGIVDRPSGIEKARTSIQSVHDAAKGALKQVSDLTTGHMLLMGLATRAAGLHAAAVAAVESDNPFAAFTLLRAYAENAAAALYAIGHPSKIDGLLGLGGAQISAGKITNYAMQGSKRFGAFREIYSQLSEYAHPMSKSIFASSKVTGDRDLRWSSVPAFKRDSDALVASGWIVELAEANAHLLAELGEIFRPI